MINLFQCKVCKRIISLNQCINTPDPDEKGKRIFRHRECGGFIRVFEEKGK